MRPADGHTEHGGEHRAEHRAEQRAEHGAPQDPPAGAARVAGGSVPRPSACASPTQASERFAAALRAAAATGATNFGPLREAVRAFMESRRDAGDPPERALIAVKERVGDALRRRPATPKGDASSLLRRVVHWAIEAYYRAD